MQSETTIPETDAAKAATPDADAEPRGPRARFIMGDEREAHIRNRRRIADVPDSESVLAQWKTEIRTEDDYSMDELYRLWAEEYGQDPTPIGDRLASMFETFGDNLVRRNSIHGVDMVRASDVVHALRRRSARYGGPEHGGYLCSVGGMAGGPHTDVVITIPRALVHPPRATVVERLREHTPLVVRWLAVSGFIYAVLEIAKALRASTP